MKFAPVAILEHGKFCYRSRIPVFDSLPQSGAVVFSTDRSRFCTKTTLCSPAETIALEAVEELFARSTVVSMQSDPQQGESSWTLLIRFQVSHDFRRSLSFRPLNNAFHPIKTFQIWQKEAVEPFRYFTLLMLTNVRDILPFQALSIAVYRLYLKRCIAKHFSRILHYVPSWYFRFHFFVYLA